MKKSIIIILLILFTAGAYHFYSGYVPVSSLKTITMPELKGQMKEICGEPHQLLPITSFNWPFPLFSPDGQYYVDITDSRFRRAEKIKLFRTDNGQPLGSYSYFKLTVYCWAEDSSGIYIANYDPGDSSLFIPFSRGGKTSPIKKLLIP